MNQTASQNAEEFGFEPGDIVQEWLWDDDVDDSIRAQIEELTGEDLVDEDYDSAVDGVIVWWRDGDDEDELSDTIVDAYAVLGNDGPLWILTPKPGRPGAASSSTVQSAAQTAGMNAACAHSAKAADKPQSIRLTLSVLTGVACCVVLLGVTECHCD